MLGLTSKTVVLRSFKYLSKKKEAAPVKVKKPVTKKKSFPVPSKGGPCHLSSRLKLASSDEAHQNMGQKHFKGCRQK
jgi:hypothetical protein